MARRRGRGLVQTEKKPEDILMEEVETVCTPLQGLNYSVYGLPRMVKDRKIRVLFIVHTLYRGGAEMATYELVKGLSETGLFDIYFVNMPSNDNYEHNCMLEKEVMESVTEYRYVYKETIPARNNFIRQYLSQVLPDIVVYSLISDIPKVIVPIPGHPPLLCYTHSNLADSRKACRYKGIDGIITVSNDMARNRIEMGCDPESIYTVYNGIDPERIKSDNNWRESLGIEDSDIVFGMVGNLNSLKRPLFALEAFEYVHKQLPNTHIIFAGNPVDQGKEVQEYAESHGIKDNVHILGLQEDMGAVYNTLDVFMNCSISEGLPVTIIEAMFSKLPCIVTSVGGNVELVDHAHTGYFFDVEDKEMLIHHMLTLSGDEDKRDGMGNRGYLKANKMFHKDVMVKNFKAILKKYIVQPEDILCSVIMPAYNAERTIGEAIDSILLQTETRFEFVIVNDGSTDGTADILDEYQRRDDRIKVITTPHLGIVEALNYGIKHSNGDILFRMDADDIALPNRLKMQLSFLEENPEIDVIGAWIIGFTDDEERRGSIGELAVEHDAIYEKAKVENPMAHPTVAMRRAAWEEVGGYKGDGRCEDYRLWIELLSKGYKFYNIPVPLLLYRRTHATDQRYHNWRDSVLDELHEMAKELL